MKQRDVVRASVARVAVFCEEVRVEIATQKLCAMLLGNEGASRPADCASDAHASLTVIVPALLKRAGQEMRLVVEGDRWAGRADPTLARLIQQAAVFREQLLASNGVGIAELAARAGVSGSHYTRVLRLGFLGPDILTVIANGRQPVGLTVTKLLGDTRLPLLWSEQEAQLGFRSKSSTRSLCALQGSRATNRAATRRRLERSKQHHGVRIAPRETLDRDTRVSGKG